MTILNFEMKCIFFLLKNWACTAPITFFKDFRHRNSFGINSHIRHWSFRIIDLRWWVNVYKEIACIQWRNYCRGAGGQMPPWQLRCGPLFRNGPLLIRIPLLPKLINLINFKPLVYANLLLCFCSSGSSILQSFAEDFLNDTCIAKIIVSLVKKPT